MAGKYAMEYNVAATAIALKMSATRMFDFRSFSFASLFIILTRCKSRLFLNPDLHFSFVLFRSINYFTLGASVKLWKGGGDGKVHSKPGVPI